MFYVGQKVVCVNGRPTDKEGNCELTKGAIYTVRWVGLWGLQPWYDERLGIRLVEINRGRDDWRPDLEDAVDMPFVASRFRPIQECKTDIGFAHEILRKVTKRKPVKATA